jgi:biotin transport system substrate-specific component
MPISFGLVAVYTTGILLKPRDAVFTQICYLMLGAIGIPVFGNFRGGIEALFGPTGGYLLTYPIMAGIVATALHSASSRQTVFVYAAISICVAHVVLYLGGTAWLSITTGISLQSAATLAVYPFIPLDILKIVFCITVVVPMRSRLCKS